MAPPTDAALISAFNAITERYRSWQNAIKADLDTVPQGDRDALEAFYDRNFRLMSTDSRMVGNAQHWIDFFLATGIRTAAVCSVD